MHAAPPVRMRLVPDRAWRAFGTFCLAFAGASFAAWVAQHARLPAAIMAGMAIAAAATSALCARAWLRRADGDVGELAWDGAQWLWLPQCGEHCVGDARVMLDLGAWLLLRFEPAARRRARWMVATSGMAGPAWPAWRAALNSRRPRALAGGDPR
jgi:hypothetical protein